MKKTDYRLKFIISMLIFGSIGIFAKNINLSSSVIILARSVIGSVFLILTVLITRKKLNFSKIFKNLPLLIISGVVMGSSWAFLFEAYKSTSVSTATIIYYFAPAIVFAFSFLLFNEKFSVQKLIGIASAVAGILIINISGFFSGGNLNGIICALLSAVLYAALMIFNKYLKGLDGLEITISQMIVAAVMMLFYVMFTERGTAFAPTAKEIILLLILGVVHTGFACYLYFSSIQNMKAQNIAILSYIDPASAMIFSVIFLGEKLSLLQILGAVLILGGTAFSQLYKNKKSI